MSRLKPSQVFAPGVDRSDKSFQFTADFLAAIFTWGGIGWVVDRWLGTAPAFMVGGFIVGNMAGIYLLYLRSRDGESTSQGPARRTTNESRATDATRETTVSARLDGTHERPMN